MITEQYNIRFNQGGAHSSVMDNFLRRAKDKIQRTLEQNKSGSKYFSANRPGELAELREDLNSGDASLQKAALKRVIAKMTVGNEVANFFAEVVKLGPSTDLELKKLVYLYVLSTARLQPEMALLAVNTFLQDTASKSPVVRALAIRTMMCIRVSAVLEYTLEPLRRAVTDSDPYVRKTAAFGIGKLFHHNMELFYQQDFLSELLTLLRDSYEIVASNAAAIVGEINDYGSKKVESDSEWVNRLIYHLPSCTEWGQVYILDLLAAQRPTDAESAETLVTRVMPRLGHTNPAVVMGAIKVIANLASKCHPDSIERFTYRINAALLTLAKENPETQYVVCRNIHALLVIFPNLLRNKLDAFYVRSSDPAYVKLEKLRLLLKLVTPAVAPSIVKEFAEYGSEVDHGFLVEVVHAVASLAIKVEAVAPDCANLLLEFVDRKPELLPHVVTASKDIVRQYPELLMVDTLIAEYGVDAIVEDEAKVSLLWMLGEYCDYVEGGQDILQHFVDSLTEQEAIVQMAILTTVVKMFLRKSSEMEGVLNSVLETLTAKSSNPDVRDRAYAYWRLLSRGISMETMRTIVHGQPAPLNVDRTFSDAMTMADLKKSINTAAAVFARPYQSFLPPYGLADATFEDEMEGEEEESPDQAETGSEAPAEAGPPAGDLWSSGAASQAPQATPTVSHSDPLADLFSHSSAPAVSSVPQPAGGADALFGAPPPPLPPSTKNTIDDLFS